MGRQCAIAVGAAVAEHAPRAAFERECVEIEFGSDDAGFGAIAFGDFLAVGPRDEGAAVERDRARLAGFGADAVARHERHHVGGRVAALDVLPVRARIDRGVVRLAADGRRIEQDFGARERHCARAFREPLVPADADADACVGRVPDFETRVARREIVLLGIAGAVGDVRLAVDADGAAVRIEDRDRVELRLARALEEADGQDHAEFACEGREAGEPGVPLVRLGEGEMGGVLIDAEVGGFE